MRRIANIALTSTLAAALAVSSTPLPAFAATGDKAQAASAAASAKKEQAASGGKEDAQHAPETDGIIVTLDKGSAGASTLSEDGGEAAVLSSPAAQTLRDAGLTPTEAFATVDGSVAIAAQPADGVAGRGRGVERPSTTSSTAPSTPRPATSARTAPPQAPGRSPTPSPRPSPSPR